MEFDRIEVDMSWIVCLVWCVGTVKSPLELSEEEWNTVFKTNLTGCWLVSKSVCIRMRDAQIKGSIINIASIAGLNRGQLPGATAYATSKAGVNMLTKVMPNPLSFPLRLYYSCYWIWKQCFLYILEEMLIRVVSWHLLHWIWIWMWIWKLVLYKKT